MDEKDSLFSIHINMEKEEKKEVEDKKDEQKEIEDKIKELVKDKKDEQKEIEDKIKEQVEDKKEEQKEENKEKNKKMNLEDEEEEEMNLNVEKKKIENEKMKIENEKKEINKMKEEIKNEREKYKEELLKKERERSRMNFLDRVNIFENRKKEPNISTSFGSFSGKSNSNKNPAPHESPNLAPYNQPYNQPYPPYNPTYNPNYNPLYNPFLQDSLPSLSELEGQYLNVRQNQEQINLLRRISNSINRNLRFGTLTQIIILVAFILYFVCISYNFYRYEGFQHKTTSSLFYLILGVFLMVCVIFVRNIYESMKKIDNK